MWSKLEFRKKFDENKIKLWENEQEIRAMTTYFIEMYSGLLDHFESHINVHTIPEIAEIIAKLMA